MAESSAPWDGILVGDASAAPYSAQEWGELWVKLAGAGGLFVNYGYLPGTGDGSYPPLQVIATGGANVAVKIGSALVNGKMYTTSTAVALTVGANASGNPRIDTVVLRVDYTAQTIRAVLRQGTPAASPVRVTLTQDASIWEIPLADIAVANGFATITQSVITDRRRAVHSAAAGWQPYAYMLDYAYGANYDSSLTLTGGTTYAFPFAIAGNMLVEQLMSRARANVSPTVIWGIYAQGTNDEGVPDKTVYRIGGRETSSSTSVTTGNRFNLSAIPAAIPLSPGAYWLLIYSSINLSVAGYTPVAPSLDVNSHQWASYGGLGANLPATIDMTLFTANTSGLSYGLRLEGRVFGQTTAF